MSVITVFKANSKTESEETENFCIIGNNCVDHSEKSLKKLKQIFKDDGEKLADCLFNHLPGGTLDVLIQNLLIKKASTFVVSFKEQ